jgi:hypothetical protein
MYYVKVKPSEVSEVTKLFKRLFKVYLEECKEQKTDELQDALDSAECQCVEAEDGT